MLTHLKKVARTFHHIPDREGPLMPSMSSRRLVHRKGWGWLTPQTPISDGALMISRIQDDGMVSIGVDGFKF
jgi:hypothetical protein